MEASADAQPPAEAFERMLALIDPLTPQAMRVIVTLGVPQLIADGTDAWTGSPSAPAPTHGVMSLGLSEKATVLREPDSTLRPSAWFLDEIDDATLAKIADLVRTAFT